MERVISGIRPTGNLHLGNYFGAVKSFVKMQDEYDCMFFIADWHSLTTHPTPENIKRSVKPSLASTSHVVSIRRKHLSMCSRMSSRYWNSISTSI